MKASELDKAFDDGEDIDAIIDWSTVRRPNLEPRRIEIDLPSWMVDRLDRHAETLDVRPQDLIKFWIAEKLS